MVLSLMKGYWWIPTLLGALMLPGIGARFLIRRREGAKT